MTKRVSDFGEYEGSSKLLGSITSQKELRIEVSFIDLGEDTSLQIMSFSSFILTYKLQILFPEVALEFDELVCDLAIGRSNEPILLPVLVQDHLEHSQLQAGEAIDVALLYCGE